MTPSRPWLITWRINKVQTINFNEAISDARFGELAQPFAQSDIEAEQKWYSSFWAGNIWKEDANDWFYWHDFLNWAWLHPDNQPGAFYAWLPDNIGWIYTDQNAYPAFYRFSDGTWHIVVLTTVDNESVSSINPPIPSN